MATTSTDPRDIEADLERERAALADTLDTLSDRVSVDNLAKEALGLLKSNAGYATSSIDHAVRANPLAVALIGAGIAWMFLGPRITGSSSAPSKSSRQLGSQPQGSGYGDSSYAGSTSPVYGGSSYESGASTGYGSSYAGAGSSSYQGGQGYGSSSSSTGYGSSSTPGGQGFGSSSYAAGGSGSYGASDYGRVGYVPSDNDDEDHAWSREAHGLRARASEALHAIEREAKSYYDSLKNGISSMTSGSSGGERDFDAEREGVISRFSTELRERFAAGLDNLPPESRDRVIAAREKAYGAMLQAERLGKDAWTDPGRVMEEHPFVAGAVAFALGAATAALLPSTDVENRTFGAERDRMLGEAARLLREERGRAMQIAGSLGQEIKQAAQETVGAVTETVTQKASEAASRVTDRASEEVRNAVSSAGGTSSSSSSSSFGGTGDPVIR